MERYVQTIHARMHRFIPFATLQCWTCAPNNKRNHVLIPIYKFHLGSIDHNLGSNTRTRCVPRGCYNYWWSQSLWWTTQALTVTQLHYYQQSSIYQFDHPLAKGHRIAPSQKSIIFAAFKTHPMADLSLVLPYDFDNPTHTNIWGPTHLTCRSSHKKKFFSLLFLSYKII